MADRIPVSILTGFLGSGKTTLLARMLASPHLGGTAVIVNEIGEVGIDHHLLRRVDERTVLLASGCVCCTLRGDLTDELLDLLGRRTRGEVPRFRRVVVETSGLADPAPILATLMSEPVVQHHFEPGTVVTTVDAVNGLRQLERQRESLKQTAAADLLVVTKLDLVEIGTVAALETRLHDLNPAATVLEVSFGDVDPRRLLRRANHVRISSDVREGSDSPHDVRAFTLAFGEQLDWTAFGIWLTMLLQARGEDLLRVKGLLNVGGAGPLVLDGVQHVVHPPVHLEAWPDDDHRSRIVFIGRGIERDAVEASLLAFNGAAAA